MPENSENMTIEELTAEVRALRKELSEARSKGKDAKGLFRRIQAIEDRITAMEEQHKKKDPPSPEDPPAPTGKEDPPEDDDEETFLL